uniref:Peptidase S59 domain-containing protein n=1 Tax=Kalanchoe fedtschenkoi TaxID=63787 RepID=A0A7N0T880_KALFE
MANPALLWSPKESAEKLQVNDLSNIAVVSSNQQRVSEEPETSELPKLQSFDYYTEPSVEELAAKERADPGYLSRVKDFVVGRRGYGRIKFNGETDVRQLDIESVLKFNHREVIV